MQRPIPNSYTPLRTLALRVANGMTRHAAGGTSPLNFFYHTESDVRDAIQLMEDAYTAWGDAKHDFRIAVTNLRADERDARHLLTTTRNTFESFLGNQHTPDWNVTGFNQGTLEIPDAAADQEPLLRALAHYLHNNSGRANAPLGVTEAALNLMAQALTDGISAVDAAQGVSVNRRAELEAAVKALIEQIRGVIGELEEQLPGTDGRWYDFGLWPPDLQGSPGPCEPFTCIAGLVAGTLVCDCDDAPLGERYQWQVQIIGTDADFNLHETTGDSDATLTGLASGSTASVRVRAANESGEGPWSHVITTVVP